MIVRDYYHHHPPILEYFHYPKKKSQTHYFLFSFSPQLWKPWQPLIHFLSLQICLLFTFLCQQNHTMCTALQLTFLTQHNVWKVQPPPYSMHQHSLLLPNNLALHDQAVFCSFIDEHLGCFPFWVMNDAVMNIHMQALYVDGTFVSLESVSRCVITESSRKC